MHSGGFFFQAFVYLVAAVVSVPIAKRLGLGSVLGYLIAGALIGPFVLGLVGSEGQDVMHFAEFGVVMMLFLVGLELQPSLLWRLRGPIVGIGGLQVLITTAALGFVGLYFGLEWKVALAIGMILALSSTAIVLQTLNEKGLMKTPAGQTCFSVLLYRRDSDARGAADAGHDNGWPQSRDRGSRQQHRHPAPIATSPDRRRPGGRHRRRRPPADAADLPLHRRYPAAGNIYGNGIASGHRHRPGHGPGRAFPRAGYVSGRCGVGRQRIPARAGVGYRTLQGTVAGPVLHFRRRQHRLQPDAGSAGHHWRPGRTFGPGQTPSPVRPRAPVQAAVLAGFLFAFALAQGGEFAFVLFSFATANDVIAPAVANPLVVAVALSMAVTPLLMIINEKLIQPLFSGKKEKREADVIDEENAVIIAGFGRFGHIVGRLLKANGVGATVLDLDPEQIEVLRRFGLKVFYGDAGRPDLLHAAGADQARLLLLAIDDEERANAIATEVKHHFPNLTILARANSLHHAYDLLRKGADHVFRETLDSALAMGVEALRQLGFRSYQAHRAARIFKRHEQQTMEEVFALWDRDADHVEHVREHMSELDRMMQSDQTDFDESRDHSWEAAAPDDPLADDENTEEDPKT